MFVQNYCRSPKHGLRQFLQFFFTYFPALKQRISKLIYQAVYDDESIYQFAVIADATAVWRRR